MMFSGLYQIYPCLNR